MDLSRLNTLSLNNSNDIIANSISLINDNKTVNILDLFALKTNNGFTNVYTKTESDTLLNLKQNLIAIGGLNINQVSTLQTNLDLRALITNVYTKTESDASLLLKANQSSTYTKTEDDRQISQQVI